MNDDSHAEKFPLSLHYSISVNAYELQGLLHVSFYSLPQACKN